MIDCFKVRDRLISNKTCYQALQTADDFDVTYQDASDFCQSELRGSLVTEASLSPTVSLSLLAHLRPQTSEGQQFQWWLKADSPESCKTVSNAGAVSQQDCAASPLPKTVRRPLCQLGETPPNIRLKESQKKLFFRVEM